MSEEYSIELKLDGTRLCVSLMHNGGWGSLEISGDNVDLAPLINAARAEGMREAAKALRPAVTIAARYDEDMTAEDAIVVDQAINYILSAIGEKS